MVVHGASHLPVDLQSLQIELSLYSHLVEHLREDCQFVLAKSKAFVAVGTGEQHIGFDGDISYEEDAYTRRAFTYIMTQVKQIPYEHQRITYKLVCIGAKAMRYASVPQIWRCKPTFQTSCTKDPWQERLGRWPQKLILQNVKCMLY